MHFRLFRREAGEDAAGLLQKVKTTDALKQMGAEHYMESVILGEVAYQVQQGFLADAHALRRAATVSQPPPAAATPAAPEPSAPQAPPTPAAPAAATASPASGDKKAGEQDMLAQFLLDNLQ